MTSPKSIAVIGAGIVGLTTALELQKRGFAVTVIDRGPAGGRQSASYGHGAWINPASIMPTSLPGLWKQVPGFLLDPEGPFVIRWKDMLQLAPWLWRFVRAGSSWEKVEACAQLRHSLCKDAVVRHTALAAAAGVSELLCHHGLIYAYPRRAAYDKGAERPIRARMGIAYDEIDEAALHAAEPALADRYTFGARIQGSAWLRDTQAYCRALAALVERQGGVFLSATVSGFALDGRRLTGVLTDNGLVRCDRAVVCAGVRSAALAAKLGDHVSLVSERGYHVEIRNPAVRLNNSFIPVDAKIAITPLNNGLRIAGQVELAATDRAPDWRRAEILLEAARKVLPGLQDASAMDYDMWMGHRPSTPDSLPVIDHSSTSADVLYAFGHGHAGPSMGPTTAAIIGALVAGEAPEVSLAPFGARRFHLSGGSNICKEA